MTRPQALNLEALRSGALATARVERFPWAGQWELTCRCNLKCVMCYTDCFNTPELTEQELSTGEIVRILDQLRDAGCLELTLTGGEPLARPDFLTIYRQAHARGLLVTVFTNGTLITRRIADCWASERPKSVEISLHGLSPEVFDGVTQVRGSLDRCLNGVRLLMTRRIPLVLKTVALTVNAPEILSVKRWADSLGADVTWRFGQYLRDDLSQSHAPYRYQLSEAELRAIEKQDPELWRAKREEITTESRGQQTCGGGKMTFHIDARGRLQLCSNNRDASYDLRTGSFEHGFYEALPTFPCSARVAPAREPVLIQLQSASQSVSTVRVRDRRG
jgi:MoaA/NifB/PqqE/SkfB family radical SAM enzyme